jgi:hypothetical protein
MRSGRALAVAVLSGGLAGVPLLAHHSVLGFDGSRGVEITGVVREVAWANPHTLIVIDDGRGARWVVESEGAGVLARLGWPRAAIAVGDRVRTAGAPARDGTHRMRCDFVQVPAGPRLPCFPAKSL